jgi:hypothetical protein
MRISNEDLLAESGAVSLGSNWTSRPIWLGHIANFSIQMFFTGTPQGTFTLEMSADAGHPNAQSKAEQSADVINWTTISNSSQPIVAAGNHAYEYQNAGFPWVRVVWVRDASTGTLTTARANVKGV